jgi:hypothetical protein
VGWFADVSKKLAASIFSAKLLTETSRFSETSAVQLSATDYNKEPLCDAGCGFEDVLQYIATIIIIKIIF